jgi:gluconate 2-dehydrogenase gamma chain
VTDTDVEQRKRLTRRGFVARAGAAAAALGLAGCGAESAGNPAELSENTNARNLPYAPPSRPPLNCQLLRFFIQGEALAVEAFTARIIPGSPEDPGAREACVTTFIDRKLAEFETFAAPTYSTAPFARLQKPGEPPPPGHGPLFKNAKELERYGFQDSLTPQESYREGLAQLDRYSRNRYGRPFAELDETTQDTILEALEADELDAFKKPGGKAFFSMLQEDTYEGMFADPVYGGNHDFAGWKLVGYPGAQRAYTPYELKHGTKRRIQGMEQLMPMRPGIPADHAILPLSGTQRTLRQP